MNFIVDENVSLAVARQLREQGHNVIAVCEGSYSGSKDQKVYDLAVAEKSVLITRDEHFSNPMRFPAHRTKGIVLIRPGNMKSDKEAELVERFIRGHALDRLEGCLVTLYRDRMTILSPEKDA